MLFCLIETPPIGPGGKCTIRGASEWKGGNKWRRMRRCKAGAHLGTEGSKKEVELGGKERISAPVNEQAQAAAAARQPWWLPV